MTKKKPQQTRWVAASIVVLLALALVGLVWLMFFMPPTSEQYSSASKQANEVKNSIGAISEENRMYTSKITASLLVSPDGSRVSEDTESTEKQYKSLLKEYKTSLAKLSHSPVARDAKVKQQINKVIKQSEVFDTFMRESVSGLVMYYQAQITCDNVPENNKKTRQCISALKKLTKAALPVYSEYAKMKLKGAKSQTYDSASSFEIARKQAVSTAELDTLIKLLDKKAAE